MDRSKRAIKTPRRFDDEAFETPPKPQIPAKPIEAVKSLPEPTPPKNIIKVKLNKVKPREIVRLKESSKSREPLTLGESVDETSKSKEAVKTKESVKSREASEPKELREPVKPKETVKPKEPIKLKECVKIKDPPKLRESQKLKEIPKIDVKPPERDVQLVYRPKMKRPRTPPVYTDLIPNVVLPFWDARTAAEDHEDDNVKELVHCHCGVAEELGLMVQCETCLTWQHAHCLGIDKPEDAPDGYTCKACSDPRFARESMKWAYDQDWLIKGRMKQFPCDLNPMPEKKVETLRQINQLIGHVLNIHQIIHSLRVKTRILTTASDDDPELKLFRNEWPATYQHRDGTQFIPTLNQNPGTPTSTISVVGETPDPGDIAVESLTDATLPDIGRLEDVSAILESTYVSNPPIEPMLSSNEVTPNDCRANLKSHIQQTEEFISIELAQIEEQLESLKKDCETIKGSDFSMSMDSLKNDLQTMKRYIESNFQYED